MSGEFFGVIDGWTIFGKCDYIQDNQVTSQWWVYENRTFCSVSVSISTNTVGYFFILFPKNFTRQCK